MIYVRIYIVCATMFAESVTSENVLAYIAAKYTTLVICAIAGFVPIMTIFIAIIASAINTDIIFIVVAEIVIPNVAAICAAIIAVPILVPIMTHYTTNMFGLVVIVWILFTAACAGSAREVMTVYVTIISGLRLRFRLSFFSFGVSNNVKPGKLADIAERYRSRET